MKRLLALAAFALLFSATGGSGLAAKPAYDKQPPGQIMQDVTAYLSGEAMNSAWHVVASRVLAGKQMGKTPAYQWYLSFYAPARNGLKLVYRLPNASNAILAKVVKAHGAQMYFPVEQLKIVGAAELERGGVQDVVVQTHEFAADCGSSTVAVFGASADMSVTARAVVTNPCALEGKLVKNGALQAVSLSGPYYDAKAALCCPTKPHAAAKLAYANGKWSVKPGYFMISASMAAHR